MSGPNPVRITVSADMTRFGEAMEAAQAVLKSPEERAWIDHIRERSYVRHVLADHIRTNDHRIPELRRKHGM